jgi:hypothetical protein
MPNFAHRLETAGLIVLDESFALVDAERALLAADLGDGRAKNISLAPGAQVRGSATNARQAEGLQSLLARYARWAHELVARLAPEYAESLQTGRTSYRPRAVDQAPKSVRKDDRRLHVDAFASQPTGGRRILRVFTNIDPQGRPRVWRTGEAFEHHARHWVGKFHPPLPGASWALKTLGVTKGARAGYDWAMLALHDAAKLDEAYQRSAPAHEIAFPVGTSWIVYTDAVVHSAISGQGALEQTFYLPLAAMAVPEAAPARILERLTGRALV